MPLPKSRTVPDLLDEIADRFPDREALVGGGRRFAYAELRDEVRTFAKGPRRGKAPEGEEPLIEDEAA